MTQPKARQGSDATGSDPAGTDPVAPAAAPAPVDTPTPPIDITDPAPGDAPKLTKVRPVVDWTTSFVQFKDADGNDVTLPAAGRDYPDDEVDALLEAAKSAGVLLVADRPLADTEEK